MPISKLGSAKRFGTRYGRTTKHQVAKIESEQRKNHPCPFCGKPKVKRVSYGIWECGSCGKKFTGKAYSVGKINVKKQKGEE